MPLLGNVTLVVIASFILIKSIDLFIKSVTYISHHLKISEYTISFLLVSVATSLPEAIVGIESALEGTPILSYGTVLGSNIVLATLIVAIPGLIGKGISTSQIFKNRDGYLSLMATLMVVAMSLDGIISQTEGFLCLISYIIYSMFVIKKATKMEVIKNHFNGKNFWKHLFLFVLSAFLIVASGEAIVTSAINISKLLNIDLGFLGLTLLAIGTSMPEIAYSIELARKNKKSEVMGNVLGSITVNSTLVLGLTALISPINLENHIKISTYIFFVFSVLLFLYFAKTKKFLDKKESFILAATYILFLFLEYF